MTSSPMGKSERTFTTWVVPLEFHQLVAELERSHRMLARLEAGLPSKSRYGPKTVEEAKQYISKQRRWLYDWIEENTRRSAYSETTTVRF